MLDNQITLSVDEGNDGVGLVNHVFTRYEEAPGRSVYIGPDHSVGMRNTLGFYRTQPKSNGNFRGTKKCSVKFTQDYTVLGVDGSNLVAPVILEVSFSIPVGLTAADELIERQKAIALLDLDATMVQLNGLLMV